MFGHPPFGIADNCVVDVRNLARAREWYTEKLEMKKAHDRDVDDSGCPFADLYLVRGVVLTLVERAAGQPKNEGERAIFFAKNLEKARDWLAQRGISVDPITSDAGGNRLFHFRDLESNAIEVCAEP